MSYVKCKKCGRYMEGSTVAVCKNCGNSQRIVPLQRITNIAITISVVVLVAAVVFGSGPLLNGLAEARFDRAVELMNEGNYEAALELFKGLPEDWECDDLILQCQTKINENKYNEAVALMDQGAMEEAMVLFQELGDYKDSPQLFERCEYQVKMDDYLAAAALMDERKYFEALGAFLKLDGFSDSAEMIMYIHRNMAVGIAAGDNHTVGLMPGGEVVAVGNNWSKQCEVGSWYDIVAIAAGNTCTVGLKVDGTVVCTNGANVYDWTDIVSVAAGVDHVVGLKSDGTVVAVSTTNDPWGCCKVEEWTDIVAIAAGDYHTVGLKADGTVVATGWNLNGRCNVSGWTDIVSISAGAENTVGLKADGTGVGAGVKVKDWSNVVATYDGYGIRNDGRVLLPEGGILSDYDDVVAVAIGGGHNVFLFSDGYTVAEALIDLHGATEVDYWYALKTPLAGWVTE